MGDALSKFVDPHSPGHIIASYLPLHDQHILNVTAKPFNRVIGNTDVCIPTSQLGHRNMSQLVQKHVHISDVCLIIDDDWTNVDTNCNYAAMMPDVVRLTLTQYIIPPPIDDDSNTAMDHITTSDIASSSTSVAMPANSRNAIAYDKKKHIAYTASQIARKIPKTKIVTPKILVDWAPKLRVLDIVGTGYWDTDVFFEMFSHMHQLKALHLQWYHLQQISELAEWDPVFFAGISNIHVIMDTDVEHIHRDALTLLWTWATSHSYNQRLTVEIPMLTAAMQDDLRSWHPVLAAPAPFGEGGLSHFYLIIKDLSSDGLLSTNRRKTAPWTEFITDATNTVVTIHAEDNDNVAGTMVNKIETMEQILMSLAQYSASIQTHISLVCKGWNTRIATHLREFLYTYIARIVETVLQHMPDELYYQHVIGAIKNYNQYKLLDMIEPPSEYPRMHVKMQVPTQQNKEDVRRVISNPGVRKLPAVVLYQMMKRGYIRLTVTTDAKGDVPTKRSRTN